MDPNNTNALPEEIKSNSTGPKKKGASAVGNKLANSMQNAETNMKEYADDTRYYQPRITTEQRYEYWMGLQQNKKMKKPPKSFISW